MRALGRFIRDARGATAIEYGFILALIMVAIMVSISQLGGKNGGVWGNVVDQVTRTPS